MIRSREYYMMRARVLARLSIESRRKGKWDEANWCLTEQQRVFKLMEFLRKE